MLTILLDTNVILRADRLRLPIPELMDEIIPIEKELAIHPYVEAEIIDSLTAPGKRGLQANFAIKIMAHFTPYLDDRDYPGTDTALLVSAKRERGVIFTFDRELRNRCLNNGIAVITQHAKGKIVVLGNEYF